MFDDWTLGSGFVAAPFVLYERCFAIYRGRMDDVTVRGRNAHLETLWKPKPAIVDKSVSAHYN